MGDGDCTNASGTVAGKDVAAGADRVSPLIPGYAAFAMARLGPLGLGDVIDTCLWRLLAVEWERWGRNDWWATPLILLPLG